MDTRIFLYQDGDKSSIDAAAGILSRSGLLAFPTETVFGLGADAFSEEAVRKIYEVKGRKFSKPLALHVGNADMAMPYIRNVPESARRLMERFWPGPLMLIFEKQDSISEMLSGGSGKVGIRVPKNKVFFELSKRFGKPIAATSANLSGHFTATEADHVLTELDGRIDGFIYKETQAPLGIESTVLDVSTRPFRLIRQGFVSVDDIRDCIGEDVLLSDDGKADASAANETSVKVILVEGDRMKVLRKIKKLATDYKEDYSLGVGVLITDGSDEYLSSVPNLKIMGSPSEPDVIAKNFFACLRAFEKEEINLVLVEGIKRDGLGWAVMDRISSIASEIIDEDLIA